MKNEFVVWTAILLTCFCSIALSSSAIAQTDQTDQIDQTDGVQWKWNQGDKFGVALEQESNIVTKVDKRTRQVDNQTIIEFDWNVEAVSDQGIATIKQAIKRIQIKTGAPGEISDTTIDLDTNEPEKRLRGLSKSLRKQALTLIDVEFTSTVSGRGEIQSVDFSPETLELLRAMPATTQIRKMFTAEGLQSLYGTAMLTLPEKKVDPGGSWTVDKTVTNPAAQFKRKSEFTFVESVGDKANFSVVTTVEAIESSSPQIRLKSFSGEGEYTLNVDAGHLVKSEVRSELETEAAYQDKKMHTNVSTTTQMKVSKK